MDRAWGIGSRLFLAGSRLNDYSLRGTKLSTFKLIWAAMRSKWASALTTVDLVCKAHAAIKMSVQGTVIPFRRNLNARSYDFSHREMSNSILSRASSRRLRRWNSFSVFVPPRISSLTPAFGDAGNYNVTFTVTDDGVPVESDSGVLPLLLALSESSEPPGLGSKKSGPGGPP